MVSGSGKSTLVTQVLAELVRCHLGLTPEDPDQADLDVDVEDASGLESFDRLVLVDQRPIGRTPRSNLATYAGHRRQHAERDVDRDVGEVVAGDAAQVQMAVRGPWLKRCGRRASSRPP